MGPLSERNGPDFESALIKIMAKGKKNTNNKGGRVPRNMNSFTSAQPFGTGGNRSILRSGKPTIRSVRDGVRVLYTEPLGTMVSLSTSLSKSRWTFGGNFSSTHWLKNIALNYAKFRVHSLRAYYVSTCPTSTSGEVGLAMATEYLDTQNWLASSSYEGLYLFQKWSSGPAYGGMPIGGRGPDFSVSLSPNEMHSSLPWYYVGTSGEQNVTYAAYVLAQAGQNDVGAKVIGRVFVEYDIELVSPTPVGGSVFRSLPSEDGRTDTTHPGHPSPLPKPPPSPKPDPPPKPDSEV